MKKIYLAVLLLIFTQLTIAQNPSFEWAKRMGNTTIHGDYGMSITTDENSNIFTTGYFSGTVDFDPGAGTTNLTSTGSCNIFIQKLDPTGNLLWVKQIGGTDSRAYSIITDISGNVYTTGEFFSTVDFDPGAGIANLTSAGQYDIFVQILDVAGNLLWAKQMGGASNYDIGLSITIDTSGNVYTTGRFEGTVDFDPGTGTANLIFAGNIDIFIQKLDIAGNLLWAKQMGGTYDDLGNSITTDACSNVYTTGSFTGTVDFDPGTGTTNLTTPGSPDIFIQKLDSSGNLLWAKQMGGTLNDGGKSITTDAGGHVYTTGIFEGTVDFDPGAETAYLTSAGGYDIFIQKLDSAGNLLWIKQMGGIDIDYGSSITTDANGNVYTTGYFMNTVDFDPGAGTTNLTSLGDGDIFILKLSQYNPSTGTEDKILNQMSIYTNPTTGLINEDLGNLTDVKINVYYVMGSVVYKKKNINVSDFQFELNVKPGIYFIEISSQNKKKNYKLIIK